MSHVLPNLLRKSTASNSPYDRHSISNQPQIVTFGGTGEDSKKGVIRRNKYERFDDEAIMYPMTTLVDVEAGGRVSPNDKGNGLREQDGDSTQRIVAAPSEIVKTRATTISYCTR